MTIIDSHCHAWAYWPYQPPVPDPESRGVVAQLLHEMDQNEAGESAVTLNIAGPKYDINFKDEAFVRAYSSALKGITSPKDDKAQIISKKRFQIRCNAELTLRR